ncbi:MAG: penicillin-binding protein 2 [Candidatus Nomurabacteria bacterium]|nr:penicillin-binding protein 2 [Candidatus Nomurabacteria bacterium]
MNYSFLNRIKIVSFFILVFAGALVLKLFFVQIIHKSSYSERADRQYATPSSDIFERGTIYFTRKDNVLVSGAVQTSGFKIAITSKDILDGEDSYKKINVIFPIDHDSFLAKVNKKDDPYQEIANRLTKEQADAINNLNIKGINIYKEKWRFYPGLDMAAQSLGLVGFKGDELAGRYGLERQYNDVLSRDKDNPYINFFAEVFSNLKQTLFSGNVENAGDLVTTIEPSVQDFLSSKLLEVKDKYNVDAVGGIIMNPTDGSIYALDVKPSFDPNDFSKIKDVGVLSNPLVENVYEFGSVVKPLVMAAGLDTGVVTSRTSYDDKGFVTVDKKQINNFDKKGRGPNTTMQEVINQSLNTGMVYVFQHLGRQNMRDYMLSYGLKDKTGIDLPNETSGLVSNLNSPRDIEYANASFGQGIAMTPIEMVRALASLGNGGNLVTPHLVSKINYDNGSQKDFNYPTTRVKFSEKTSTEITRMLVNAMDNSLKGGTAKFEHYSVAIKTGTAQVAKENGGGYYADRYTHSFFGYFPAYNPKFIIFLYAVNPKGVPYASQTWADPFLDIVKFLMNYYEVPPDR